MPDGAPRASRSPPASNGSPSRWTPTTSTGARRSGCASRHERRIPLGQPLVITPTWQQLRDAERAKVKAAADVEAGKKVAADATATAADLEKQNRRDREADRGRGAQGGRRRR